MMKSTISLLLLFSAINTLCIGGTLSFASKALGTFSQSTVSQAKYFITNFAYDLNLRLLEHPRWKKAPITAKNKIEILDAVIYVWKNELFATCAPQRRKEIIMEELQTMSSFIIQQPLSFLLENMVNQDFHSIALSQENEMQLIYPLESYLITNRSINDYVANSKELTARTLAIATYSLYQIAVLLDKTVDIPSQLDIKMICSSQGENLAHLAINFNKPFVHDLLQHYSEGHRKFLKEVMFDMIYSNDIYGINAHQLYLYQYHKDDTSNFMTVTDYNINYGLSDSMQVIEPVISEKKSITKLCVISSIMSIGLFANIVLFISKHSQLLSSIKSVFIVSICSVISWIQCINHYMQYFNFYSNKKYHYVSGYIIQSIAYFYVGMVMLFILNHWWKIACFRAKVYGRKRSYILIQNGICIKWSYSVLIILIPFTGFVFSILCLTPNLHILSLTMTQTLSQYLIFLMLIICLSILIIANIWNQSFDKSNEWEKLLQSELGKNRIRWLVTNYLLYSTLIVQSILAFEYIQQLYPTLFRHTMDICVIIMILTCCKYKEINEMDIFPQHSKNTIFMLSPADDTNIDDTNKSTLSAEVKEICMDHIDENGIISPNILKLLMNKYCGDKMLDSQASHSKLVNIVNNWTVDKVIHLLKQLEKSDMSTKRQSLQFLARENMMNIESAQGSNSNISKRSSVPMLSSLCVTSNKTNLNNQDWRPKRNSVDFSDYISHRKQAKYKQRIGKSFRPRVSPVQQEHWQIEFFSDSSIEIITESNSTEITSGRYEHY